jgi:hypothetical protein
VGSSTETGSTRSRVTWLANLSVMLNPIRDARHLALGDDTGDAVDRDGTEYLDVHLDEWKLHIEGDGRLGQDRAREAWRDMRRDNRSEMLGLRGLRYGWADVVDRPCAVAIEQAVVLRQQGWAGLFTSCPHCPKPVHNPRVRHR